MSSGTIESSTSQTVNNTTTSYSSSSTFDGSVMTTNTTSSGTTTTSTSELTIEYSFNRETGEYSSVQVENDPEHSYWNYIQVFDDASGNYDYNNVMYVDRREARESTTEVSGFFTITGDAGDEIEKNSQVVFQERMRTLTYTDTYTYFVSGTETPATVSGKYYYSYDQGAYVPFETSNTATETNEGESAEAMVWNVVDLNKDELMVEYTNSSSQTSSYYESSYTTTSEVSWTLTAK